MHVLIVNPLSATKFFSNSLRQAKIKVTALFNNLDALDPYFKIDPNDFDNYLQLDGDYEHVLKECNLQVDCVINGCDQSIILADLLAMKLTPHIANNTSTSYIRSSKYAQQIALAKKSLPTIWQRKIELASFTKEELLTANFKYPVFVKPLNGAGSVGAGIAYTSEEVFKIIKSCPSKILLEQVNEYLIQEYIEGKELVVDSFSANGTHTIANIYEYKKDIINQRAVYREMSVLYDQTLREKLATFAIECLNACDLKFGFAHMEFFILADGSLRLVELNPRISGASGSLNILTTMLGSYSQDQLLAKFITNKSLSPANTSLFGSVVMLYDHSPIDFSMYPSFRECITINTRPLLNPHDSSLNLLDVRKCVILVNNDKQQLMADSKKLIADDII